MSARRWKRWAHVAALSVGIYPTALSAQAAPTTNPTTTAALSGPLDIPALAAEMLARDVKMLRQGVTQAERDEAAKRLIARQKPAADDLLRQMMTDGPAPAQVAITRAIPVDFTPDPKLIPPLIALLSTEPRTAQDAAYALASYRDPAAQQTATRALLDFVRDAVQSDRRALRAGAIRGLGGTTDKAAAEALVKLVTDGPSSDIRQAAADALAEMTTLRDMGNGAAAWTAWWDENKAKREDKFRSDLLERQSVQKSNPPADMEPAFQDLYRQAAASERPAFLKRLLSSADAPMRGAGIRLARRFEPGLTDRILKDQIRALVNDSASDVRLEASTVLEQVSDADSFPTIITQITQEPDSGVRAAMTEQVWRLGDARAIDVLKDLLQKDSVTAVAIAASRALGQVEKMRGVDVVQKRQVIATLQQTMNGRGLQPGNESVRAACIESLAQLGDASLKSQLPNLLRRQQEKSPLVRKAAMNAIATLGDPQMAIVASARLDDTDAEVRKAGLDALGRLSEIDRSFAFAATIFAFTDESQKESDPQVRERAWEVFKKLLPLADVKQLNDLTKQNGIAGNPERLLFVYLALAPKQADADLAYTRENIGTAYMELKEPRANDAATYFKLALEYWQTQRQADPVIDHLYGSLLGALLGGKNYPAAVDFVEKTITRDSRQTSRLANSLTTTAEKLVDSRDPASALRLIAAMKDFGPAKDILIADRLTRTSKRADAMQRSTPSDR